MAAAAAAHALAQATKASGVIVKLEPDEFQQFVMRVDRPLVVHAATDGGIFGAKYEYLTPWRGLAFYTKSRKPVQLPGSCDIIRAKKIWVPD